MEQVPGPRGGKLNVGGKQGNKGGGRPKSEVRLLAQQGFEKALPGIIHIACESDSEKNRIAASDMLGKYAGLQQIDLTTADGIFDLSPEQRRSRIAELFDRRRAAGTSSPVGDGEPTDS